MHEFSNNKSIKLTFCRQFIAVVLLAILFISLNLQIVDINGVKVSDIATLLITMYLVLSERKICIDSGFFIMLVLYILVIYFPLTLFSIDYDISVVETTRFILATLTFLVAFHLSSTAPKLALIIVFKYLQILFLGLIIIVYALENLDILPKLTFVMPELPRRQAFMLDPNYLCYWIITVGICIIKIDSENNSVRSFSCLLLFFLTCAVTLFTYSRAGYLYLTLFCLQYFAAIYSSPESKNISKFIFFMLFLVGLCFVIFDDLYFLEEILKRQELESQSGEIRFDIWRGGIDAFLENPLGYGPGTFSNAASPYSRIDADAHNTILWVMVNNGIFGLLFFAILSLYTSFKIAKFNFFILIGTVFFAMVLTFDTFRNFYFILGFILGYTNDSCRNIANYFFERRAIK